MSKRKEILRYRSRLVTTPAGLVRLCELNLLGDLGLLQIMALYGDIERGPDGNYYISKISVTKKTLAEVSGISLSTIKRRISKLEKDGILQKTGVVKAFVSSPKSGATIENERPVWTLKTKDLFSVWPDVSVGSFSTVQNDTSNEDFRRFNLTSFDGSKRAVTEELSILNSVTDISTNNISTTIEEGEENLPEWLRKKKAEIEGKKASSGSLEGSEEPASARPLLEGSQAPDGISQAIEALRRMEGENPLRSIESKSESDDRRIRDFADHKFGYIPNPVLRVVLASQGDPNRVSRISYVGQAEGVFRRSAWNSAQLELAKGSGYDFSNLFEDTKSAILFAPDSPDKYVKKKVEKLAGEIGPSWVVGATQFFETNYKELVNAYSSNLNGEDLEVAVGLTVLGWSLSSILFNALPYCKAITQSSQSA